jgi:hypothetical protein
MSWIKIFTVNVIVFLVVILIIEFCARLLIDFDTNFYAAPQERINGTERVHPYGIIPVNTEGFFDGEWSFSKDDAVFGYFGDSVTYGVGAGYPYRISEYLDHFWPEIEHINLSGGIGIDLAQKASQASIIKTSNRFDVDKVIYLMNLNDIAPLAYYVDPNTQEYSESRLTDKEILIRIIKDRIAPLDRLLRGRSVFYTYLRLKIKSYLVTSFEIEASGYRSIELDPDRHAVLIKRAAKNLADITQDMQAKVAFCTIILPYEMQISKDAAEEYRKIGVKFSDAFREFKTQKFFVEEYKKWTDIKIHWVGEILPENPIGTFYVFNRGDKIDFNHPNGKGHKELASEIASKKLCSD